jgi:hypothetical protein
MGLARKVDTPRIFFVIQEKPIYSLNCVSIKLIENNDIKNLFSTNTKDKSQSFEIYLKNFVSAYNSKNKLKKIT